MSAGRQELFREWHRREAERRRLRALIESRLPSSDAQTRFHLDTFRQKQLRGANRAGKTKGGARESLYLLTQSHPTIRLNTKASPRGRVVCYSFKQSRAVQRALSTLCPPELIHPDCSFSPITGYKHQTLRLATGAVLEVATAKQGTLAHSGDDLDFVWCDEPPDPGHWSELVARVFDRDGYLFLTYTPIGRPCGWLKELVDDGVISDHLVRLTTEDCPWLSQDKIDLVTRTYLPAEWDQRVNGAWEGVTTGRVFSGFSDRSIFDDLPDHEFAIYLGFDHGEKSGKEVCHVIAVAEDEVWVVGEYVSDGATTPMVDAQAVVSLLSGFGWSPLDVSYARGDVNSAGKLGGGMRINGLLERAFADLSGGRHPPFPIRTPEKGRGSVVSGCRMLNVGLLDKKVHIHRSCTALIRSLRHWTGLNDDLKDPLDSLRYIGVDFLRDTTNLVDRLVIR